MNEAGALTEARVIEMLDRLPEGTTEIFFHPATAAFAGADRGTETFAWERELAALTSGRVRDAVAQSGAASVTYGELAASAR